MNAISLLIPESPASLPIPTDAPSYVVLFECSSSVDTVIRIKRLMLGTANNVHSDGLEFLQNIFLENFFIVPFKNNEEDTKIALRLIDAGMCRLVVFENDDLSSVSNRKPDEGLEENKITSNNSRPSASWIQRYVTIYPFLSVVISTKTHCPPINIYNALVVMAGVKQNCLINCIECSPDKQFKHPWAYVSLSHEDTPAGKPDYSTILVSRVHFTPYKTVTTRGRWKRIGLCLSDELKNISSETEFLKRWQYPDKKILPVIVPVGEPDVQVMDLLTSSTA